MSNNFNVEIFFLLYEREKRAAKDGYRGDRGAGWQPKTAATGTTKGGDEMAAKDGCYGDKRGTRWQPKMAATGIKGKREMLR
jgi:hypothetical protein